MITLSHADFKTEQKKPERPLISQSNTDF